MFYVKCCDNAGYVWTVAKSADHDECYTLQQVIASTIVALQTPEQTLQLLKLLGSKYVVSADSLECYVAYVHGGT